VLLAAGITQCRMVTDRVVRAQVGDTQAAGCMKECNDRAKESMDVEHELHKSNVQACNSDPTCLANEEARHDAAMAAIQAEKKRCHNGCHHQGGGRGGR